VVGALKQTGPLANVSWLRILRKEMVALVERISRTGDANALKEMANNKVAGVKVNAHQSMGACARTEVMPRTMSVITAPNIRIVGHV